MAGIFGLIGAAAGLAGDKPDVPTFKPVSAQQAQQTALTGNLSVLPQAESLASSLNLFNQQQLEALLARAIPDYAKIQAQTSQNILDMLQGKVPDAVQTATRSAERAVAGGFAGTQAAGDLRLRDLGIESLKYTQAGLDATNRWIATQRQSGVAPLANASAMFVSPAEQISLDEWNTTMQWNRDWLTNRIKAMPGPIEQEAMGIFDWMDQTGKDIAGSYIGMMTGSMGAGGKVPGTGGGAGQPTTMTGSFGSGF